MSKQIDLNAYMAFVEKVTSEQSKETSSLTKQLIH